MAVVNNNLFSSMSIPPPGFTPRATAVMDTFLFSLMTSEDDVGELEELDRRGLERIAPLLTSDSDYFTKIVRNQDGSRRVEKMLGKSKDVDTFICAAIVSRFLPIMTDKYASHVAVRAMAVFDREKRNALYKQTLDHAFDLARDPHGCIALNKIITDTEDACFRDQIADLIALNALYLSHHDSGNLVVQQVLKLGYWRSTYNIALSLSGHCVELSFDKNGSDIVDQILNATVEPMVEVVMELLDCEQDRLMRLATNEFGNVVVSKALKVTQEEMETAYLYFALADKLMPFLHHLRNSHGSDIANTLDSVNDARRRRLSWFSN